MKPLELIKLWSDLQNFFQSAATDEQKVMVGEEVLKSLPPSMLCTHSVNTRALIEELIRKELENYRGKPKPEAASKEVKAKVRTGKR